MAEFLDSLDIANRACQHCGVTRIAAVDEDSKNNNEIAFVYGKVRRAELRRNVWGFAIRYAYLRPITATMLLLDPKPWSALVTYLPGAIVADDNGDLWTSPVADNLNNEPGQTTAWDQYFGPLTADLFDGTTTYSAGEMVYKPQGNPGGFVVFMSLINANADVPDTVTAWDATVTYNPDAVVSYGSVQYRSLIPLNTANTPANGPAAWSISVTYSAANTVTASDGFIYTSIAGGNVGNDPTTDGAVHWTNTTVPNAWTSLPTIYPASTNWRAVHAGLKNLTYASPIGAGNPSASLFRLPASFLRLAPQTPKAGLISYLGAPGSPHYLDWEINGKFITSAQAQPILFRFVADITTVTEMDDLFCEGFGCRIAFEVCEALTQSTGKLQNIGAAYKTFMTEARLINAIEQGASEPPLDDWIAARA